MEATTTIHMIHVESIIITVLSHYYTYSIDVVIIITMLLHTLSALQKAICMPCIGKFKVIV